jgi:hypothetical protein
VSLVALMPVPGSYVSGKRDEEEGWSISLCHDLHYVGCKQVLLMAYPRLSYTIYLGLQVHLRSLGSLLTPSMAAHKTQKIGGFPNVCGALAPCQSSTTTSYITQNDPKMTEEVKVSRL